MRLCVRQCPRQWRCGHDRSATSVRRERRTPLIFGRGELHRIVDKRTDGSPDLRLHGVTPLSLCRPEGKRDVLFELGPSRELQALCQCVVHR